MTQTHRRAAIAAALGLLAVVNACENQPTNRNNSMTLSTFVRDWSVGVTSSAFVGVIWRGDVEPSFALAADEYFPEHLRLYSIDTGLPVPGEVRVGFYDLDGEMLSDPYSVPGQQEGYSFVPDAPLVDGWYILAVDLGTYFWPEIPREGGVGYARFLVGSTPVWYATDLSPLVADDVVAEYVVPIVSEPLLGLTSNPFSLRINGETEPSCVERRDAASGQWYWECPSLTAESEITLMLDDATVVSAVEGVRTQTFPGTVARYRPLVPRLGVNLVRGTP